MTHSSRLTSAFSRPCSAALRTAAEAQAVRRKGNITMRAKAFLYPNPPFQGATLRDIWGQEYVMQNEPFLEVGLRDLNVGEYEVEVLFPVRLRTRLSVSSSQASVFFSHQDLANPSISQVVVRLGGEGKEIWQATLPVFVHSIHGQVRDFEGRPSLAYLWAVEEDLSRPQAMVKTDADGNFVFWYPEGKRTRLFIADESYSQSTYECWVMLDELQGDVEICPRIGDLEVWGLHCWHNEHIWQVYFWPVSLPLDLRARKVGREQFYGPRLTKEDVTIRLNGRKVLVNGFRNVWIWAGGERKHLACLLEFPFQRKEKGKPTLVQVEVCTRTRGRGEAWYISW